MLASDAGMLVKRGVSPQLNLLVCRDPHAGTSKLPKAEQYGIVVIDQEPFLAVAGAGTPSPSSVGLVLNRVANRRRATPQAAPRPNPTGPTWPPTEALRAPSQVIRRDGRR